MARDFVMSILNTFRFTTLMVAIGALLSDNVPADDLPGSGATFQFGVIADCQYCSDPGTGVRKYSMSVEKLERCVDHLNTLDLDYVVHLGDFIDRDFESFDVVNPIYHRLAFPKYHVLGNHDFSVVDDRKKDVPGKLGLASRYYDFAVKGWRFVVLDGNDISFYAHPANSPEHQETVDYYERNKIDSPDWNGAVGPRQVSWLEKVLEQAAQVGEKVVLYCHFPVYPENVHNLWNAREIVSVIERFPCVKAYLNGHNHAGNYGIRNGVHYLTFKGMVDTGETAYATVTVHEDRLEISGYGRESNRILEIAR